MPNADQIAYWNGSAGAKWAQLADSIDHALGAALPELLAAVAPMPGETILDVGCGAGALSCALAPAVEPDGRIYALDISPPLLAVAARRFAELPTPPHVIEADAQTTTWKRAYDAAVSRFGVMFFDDPLAAFSNIAAALRPGGRLVFQCWRQPADNEWVRWIVPVVRALAPDLPPADLHAPGPFALSDSARTVDILTQAGFANATARPLDFAMRMGAGDDALEQAVGFYLKIGPCAAALAAGHGDAETAARLLRSALATHITGASATPSGATWLVSARRP